MHYVSSRNLHNAKERSGLIPPLSNSSIRNEKREQLMMKYVVLCKYPGLMGDRILTILSFQLEELMENSSNLMAIYE